MRKISLFMIAALALAAGGAAQPTLTGQTRIHDPSVIVVNGTYVAFGTGNSALSRGAVRVKTSPDGIDWKERGAIGKGVPAWTEKEIGTRAPEIWAPSVSKVGGTIYLYYAASTFGQNTSTIGLTTNATFDPADPTKGWIDRGAVLTSHVSYNFNAIDPFRIDTPDGKAWLALGSFWSGIQLRELNPASGKLQADAAIHHLASRRGGAIEAASILRHGDNYFLFVSFDKCCAGVDSTYRIMVGRADAVTGPYAARDGTPMMQGGATEIQKSSGRFVGPGGQEAFATAAGDFLVYHYYDAKAGGSPQLAISPIRWDADGWPQLDPLPAN